MKQHQQQTKMEVIIDAGKKDKMWNEKQMT